jgi:hypothetical protein
MKNFLQIGQIDPLPLLHALAFRPGLWNMDKVRTWHEDSAHKNASDIILRYNDWDGKEESYVEQVCSELQVKNYPTWDLLPQAQALIFPILARVEGLHLGRVFITKIPPGGIIASHVDRIAPAEEAFPEKIPPAVYYNRYHAVLQSSPGTLFRCGDETLWLPPGTVWWFNNSLEHEVVNNGADDRIHLVLDIHVAGRLQG